MLSYQEIIKKIDQLEEANILLVALKFGIFTILEKKSLSATQVAKKAGTSAEETGVLLDTLVAMSVVKKSVGKFSNTSVTYKHFCASSPHYKPGTIMLKLENRDEWSQLHQIIQSGRNPTDYAGGDDAVFRRQFTFAMHERSQPYAQPIAKFVTRKPVGRLLDLGGGPGSYSAAILKMDKKTEATILDRASAIEVGQEIHQSSNVFHRMKFEEGDLFDSEWSMGFDTVLFSNILHIYNPRENKTLLKKIRKILTQSGRLIIVDLFLNKNKTTPYEAACFSLTMLLFTETGKTYTFDECKALLTATGFSKFQTFKIANGSSLIEAIKN